MVNDNDLKALCKKLYELNSRYKIEYDDLYQQSWVIMLECSTDLQDLPLNKQLKFIEKRLNSYIYYERKNPLADAISIDNDLNFKRLI